MNVSIWNLIVVLGYSLFATWVATEYFVKKLVKYGYTVEDKYKPGRKKIPTMGGIAMFAGVMVALALSQILIKNEIIGRLFIFYFIVIVYAMYGVIDDLFGFKKRYDKIIILLVLSLPIASLLTHDTINILGWKIYLDGLVPYVIAPIYVMVVANLLNVHSGFNGLSTGLGIILLIAAGIKSYMLYGFNYWLFLFPILGAALAFLPYNWFPAKALEGNVGQFMIGSALGAFLVMNQLEFFGFVILIPHIVNFLLDTWVLAILKIPDVKFGSVRKDGTIIAPESVRFKSLKYLLTYYFRVNERTATILLYIPTIVFCIIGVLWV